MNNFLESRPLYQQPPGGGVGGLLGQLGYNFNIMNGTDAHHTQSQYIVSLQKNTDNYLFCGESIISALYILTAAHCVDRFVDNPGQIKVNFYSSKPP